MIKYLRLAIQFVCYNIIQLLPLAVLLDTLQMPNGSFVFGEVMKEIALTQGYVALVDDDMFDELNRMKWCITKKGANIYAVTGNDPATRMHRFIMNAPSNVIVDHINGDGLDNRRCNLRLCTNAENGRNRRGVPSNNTSGYLGVTWDARKSKWRAQIFVNGNGKTIGHFDDARDAARARDKVARELFGEFATLNIID